MKYVDFKNNCTILSDIPVKGRSAQLQMAPKIRHNITDAIISERAPKKAAVLCLFYPDLRGNVSFLLILRAQYEGTHSSQIGFPGGKYDLRDNTLENTALRETYEEVGVPKHHISIFKKMTDTYIPPSNFLVSTYLGTVDYLPSFKTNHEVEDLICTPLEEFLDENIVGTMQVKTSYLNNITTPCFILGGHQVWGATAMMLSEIKELLKEI